MKHWESVDQVRLANERIGQHWFDPDTVAWWGTRIESGIIQGMLFITSEVDRDGTGRPGPRVFTIRAASPIGLVDTVGEFGQYPNLESATLAALRLDVSAYATSRLWDTT